MQHIEPIAQVDPEIHAAITQETQRQFDGIEMIPSENYVSEAVLAAMGTVLTNKYSEGYAGKRYYGGNEHIDTIETLAIERAKALFGADHANVQPYSGSPANLAVYMALAKPSERIMGMALTDGGHLSHGHKVNFSAKYYEAEQYPVAPETGLLDYEIVYEMADQFKPKLLWAGLSAYPRQIDFARFAQIAEAVGAYLIADIAHISGLVATGLHPDPVPYADAVTMTTHKLLRGPRGALILSKAEHARAIDRAVFPGLQGGPHNPTTAATAVALHEAQQPTFRSYCEQVIANAKAFADELTQCGLTPVTGGTDNHIVLVDMTPKGRTGKEVSQALDRAGITANANTVPGETRSPFDPSGVRFGTPAATTRGFKEDDLRQLARWVNEIVEHIDDDARIERIRAGVKQLCEAHPLWY
jgi:glycine hydroxymethyltransferase